MKKFLSWKILAIIIAALVLGFFDLPAETQQKLIPFAPESFAKNKIHLGLDLQGGSQLDYKVDLRKVLEADRESIVEGVKEVLERRVNSLGVAEPNIYISDIAGEQHVIVELAETAAITQEDVDNYLGEAKSIDELSDDEKKLVSLEKAKATVGKTIQLEFKEEKAALDPQEKDKIKGNAMEALSKIKRGDEFLVVGQEEQQAYPGKVTYKKSGYIFEDEIPLKIKETILGLKAGEFTQELVETGGSFIIDESGQAVEEMGLAIIKLIETKEETKNEKEVDASHILISYAGLDTADASVTRTEDEAYELAKELKQKLEDGANFAAVAKDKSDDKSNSELGGKLDIPVTGDGAYVSKFEEATLALTEVGELSEITKTKFGYHIIKVNKIQENVSYTKYQYEIIDYSTVPDPWQDTGLTGKHFVHADVALDNFYQSYVLIQFNDEGAKLFEEITEANIDKPLAIFVGGELISAPPIDEKIAGGSAKITGQFTNEEAKALARDLNTGAIPAPIVLTGEYTIGATLGQEALSKSLMAGLIGLLLVMLFMIANYRIAGLVADASLAIYAVILLFLIKSQLHLGVALAIALAIFAFLVVKIVNNKDSGWEKLLSFILSCFAFFFLTYLLKTGIILTLAGVAGIILSIGIAVDANILIFERFKEELKGGKSFGAAVESGFNRAWSAIRDSNFSTLLTCAILFYFGSSIIRGFAFTLAAGIIVSMFTAITITKTFLQGFVGKKIAQNLKAFGVSEKPKPSIQFIKKSKVWLSISGVLVGISILSMIVFGLRLGIDFQGGTLLEFSFKEPVTKETLANTLQEIEKEMEAGEMSKIPSTTTEPDSTEEGEPTEETTSDPVETTSTTDEVTLSTDEVTLSTDEATKVDLTKIQILESGENDYIVKTKYLTSEAHDQIIAKMKDRLPSFTEPRFTTIGPVIGKTMLHKAIIAIIFALIMIIIYIGLAFRKIPKEVSPWRFGLCAIVALAHDVIIVTGIFTILGYFLNVEIDALFITAILTVFGYSVNDTIVIFDRLRENLIRQEHEDIKDITDKSLNQTLRRSLNTSISTLITLVAILVLGSSSIFYFILALTIGTAVGTYSSIFTASPLLVRWTLKAKKKEAAKLQQ